VLEEWKEKKAMRALFVVALLVLATAVGASVATRPACERTIVTGSLVSDLDFRVTAVAVYARGMIYGNPLLAHVEGTVPGPGWYSIPLPGFVDPDHVRVRSSDAPVTAFHTEDEGKVTFDVLDDNATFPAVVTIDYIAGTAWWANRFELDLDRGDLSMVGRVFWQAESLFRGVDLLLVSGEVHVETRPDLAPPASMESAGAPGFGLFSPFTTSTPSGSYTLSAFSVPSSRDAGVYVVHRAQDVDLPGAAGKDAKTCPQAGFSVRVYESPVSTAEYVEAVFSGTTTEVLASDGPARLPSFLVLANRGDVPWVPGTVEVWKDAVLVGSDTLGYTPTEATTTIQTGTSLDIWGERVVESTNTTDFVNYTLGNNDAVAHRVRLVERGDFGNVSLAAPFAREEGAIVAYLELAPHEELTIGFTAR
jgi:hypothetical protein